MSVETSGWREWLDRLSREGKLPKPDQTFQAMSEAFHRATDALEGAPPTLADIRSVTIPGPAGPIAGRLYTPLAAGLPPGGGLVFLHGGGFIIGDLDTHDRLCRRFAAASHVRILAVDYRLAPAHKFPAALEDSLAAFDWAAGEGAEAIGFDPERVAVGGDSAGGTLSATIAQERRRGGDKPAPAFQLLLYPLLQLVENHSARPRVLEGHLMASAIFDHVCESYLNAEDDRADARVSPLFAKDLSDVCPAYIVTAGLDPLQHEGRAYADNLAAAGVAVKTAHYPPVPHGFMQMTAVLDIAREAIDVAAAELAAALKKKTTV